MDRNVVVGTASKASDQNYSINPAGDASYAGLDEDKYDEIWINPATVDRTYTFPDPANNTARRQIVRNVGDGTHKMTALPLGAEKIIVYSGNEAWELTSFELLQAGDWAEFESDGTNWIKINAPYWHKFSDPATGWKANKTAGWTADQFTPGGLEVTFNEVPIGTLMIRSLARIVTSGGELYSRKADDANISNTPNGSEEFSHEVMNIISRAVIEIGLSSDQKSQFAVSDTNMDLYISYAKEYYQ